METLCSHGDATCRAHALAAALHSFNLYCASISAALICCCSAGRNRPQILKQTKQWRGQNIRGTANIALAVIWCCSAASASLRPADAVRLVAALIAPLSWLAAAILHISIWTRLSAAPILYLAVYWILSSSLSTTIVIQFLINGVPTTHLEVYLHGIAAVLALITSGVDIICFYDEVRKRSRPKMSSTLDNNHSYKHHETHFYSKISFFWLNSLLYRGYKLPLEQTDLGEIPDHEQSKKFSNRFKKYYHEQKTTKSEEKNSIYRCYIKMVWPNFYIAGILKFLSDISAIIPAIGLSVIIQYMESNSTQQNNSEVTIIEFFSNGYVMLCIITISLILQALLSQNSTHLVTVEGTRLKIAIQDMVYEKCMRLASWSPEQEISEQSPLMHNREDATSTQSGLLINLMSQDTYNVMSSIWICHYVWSIPIKVAVILYLLYQKLGVSALIGTFTSLLLITPIQFYIGKKLSDNTKEIAKCTDHRISKMSEILQGINVIKLYVWEDLFNEKILQLREVELKLLNKDSINWGFLTFTTQVSAVLVTVMTFTMHYIIDGGATLTAVNIFAGLALFNQLAISFLVLPVAVLMIIQAVVSTNRIKDFLDLPEALNIKDDDNEDYNSAKNSNKFNDTLLDINPEENPLSEQDETTSDCKGQISDYENTSPLCIGQEYLVRFRNAAFSWRMKENFWVEVDDLDIPVGKLIMVVGASGSGKSSLLSAILGELHHERGDININENCSMWYAGQPPWFLERSIRDNIVMGSLWCAKRYSQVVRASGLRPDLQLLPDGDETQLGLAGAPLSGGQRVRVGVARALYSRAQLLLFDEPLAALDAALARHVAARALCPAARAGRTVLLATNRLELLHYADMVIAMEDGRVTGFGKANSMCEGVISQWARLAAEARAAAARGSTGPPGGAAQERTKLVRTVSRKKFQREISEDSLLVGQDVGTIHGVVGAYLLTEVPTYATGTWHRPRRLRCPMSRQFSSPPSSIQRFKWGREVRRTMSEDASETTLQRDSSLIRRLLQSRPHVTLPGRTARSICRSLNLNADVAPEERCTNETEVPPDSTLTSLSSNGVETNAELIPDNPLTNKDETEPVSNEGIMWWEYARACGWLSVAYGVAAAASQALSLSADYWLSRLVPKQPAAHSHEQMWDMVVAYAWWCAGACAAAAGSLAAGAGAGAAARRALHERLLRTSLHRPLTHYTSPASTLHRFSADIHVVDKKLPLAFSRWYQLALLCGAALLVNAITSPWTLLALIPACIFYLTIQTVYLKNARELQHAEAESATRVLSLAAQTFAGAVTIRAGRLQPRMRHAFSRCLDENHNTLLLFNSANRWLGLSMDLLGAACVFVSLAVALCSGNSGAVIGLAGTYALLLPLYLAHLAKCRADLDLQLAAVERIMADTTLPQEDYREDCPIPPGWQRNGKIEYQDVTVQYQANMPPVLKNISLNIEPGQKVAICGRSGSGKSTLLLSCVGGTTIKSGRILIDGQDVTRVPLRTLRHRIVVLPQENIMFTGTLRENLDPLGVHTDEEIWQCLRAVGLYDFVHAQSAGLECSVGGSGCGGGATSRRCSWQGARACRAGAARAALHARAAAALLLDEPAATLDAAAERALRSALAALAPNTTILTVAHRIPSVREYDGAVVLEAGRVAERGAASALLADPGSRLTRTLAAIHRPA